MLWTSSKVKCDHHVLSTYTSLFFFVKKRVELVLPTQRILPKVLDKKSQSQRLFEDINPWTRLHIWDAAWKFKLARIVVSNTATISTKAMLITIRHRVRYSLKSTGYCAPVNRQWCLYITEFGILGLKLPRVILYASQPLHSLMVPSTIG